MSGAYRGTKYCAYGERFLFQDAETLYSSDVDKGVMDINFDG